MDYANFPARRAEAARASILEVTMGEWGTEYTEDIRFAEDGDVDCMSARNPPARDTRPRNQLTSQRLGIDGEKIRVRQGDTDTIPTGGGTGGSRSLYSEGQAILLTADSVIDKGKQAAAEVLEAAPADTAFSDGSFSHRRHRSQHRHHRARRRLNEQKLAALGEQAVALDAAEVANVAEHPPPMAATWPKWRST